MKIAVVCTGFPIPTETFVINQVVGFMEMGNTVDIFPYRKWPALPGLSRQIDFENNIIPSVVPPKAWLKRLGSTLSLLLNHIGDWGRLIKTLNPFLLGRSALNLTVFFSAIPFLNKSEYDLVIAHFGENGIGMERLIRCGFLKGPLVTVFHGYDMHFTPETFRAQKNHYKDLFNTGAFFIVNSQYGLKKINTLGAPTEKCFVVPAGLYFAGLQMNNFPRPKNGPIRFCSVGRLMQLKGHHFALQALALLNERGNKDWNYTVAGEGEEKTNLETLAETLGLKEQVFLPGHLDTREIRELLKDNHILIHPSITDFTGRAEAQGLAIQEAQAIGLPVVAFNSGGIAEGVPPQTGILVPEGDVEALAGAIEKLVLDSVLRSSMGEAGRRWALEHYDVLKLNKRILQIVGMG